MRGSSLNFSMPANAVNVEKVRGISFFNGWHCICFAAPGWASVKSSRKAESLRSLSLTQMPKEGQELLLQKHIPQALSLLLSGEGKNVLLLHHQSRGLLRLLTDPVWKNGPVPLLLIFYWDSSETHFTRACSDRGRGNGFQMKEGRFRWTIRKKFIIWLRHWNQMSKEAVDDLSLKVFRAELDGPLSNLV